MTESTPSIYRFESKVDRYHDGWRLDEYLTHRFRYHPREMWLTRLAHGHIWLNGVLAGSAETVHAGDVVGYQIEIIEPPVDFSYDVVHSDDDILVVSKSGNIPVHASGKYIRHTLVARLREDFGEKLDLSHRLDRETSGLVVLSRNTEASRALGAAFREGRIAKSYLAVVRGDPGEDEFVVDAPLRKVGKQHPIPRMVVDTRCGKAARTIVRVVERLEGVTLLEARPLTGRTNQVRAHLELSGLPLVGDKAYGLPARLLRKMVADPDDPEVLSHLEIRRHALHHQRMAFEHPRTGTRLSLHAPLAADLAAFVESRRR
ncbi:MAG: RluA family pseudouridine synthase [Candidatus Eisenbacteria bacterium]|nr:RluA family pseudouridine synthase [Candidatus Eisenbacteria bacterium]